MNEEDLRLVPLYCTCGHFLQAARSWKDLHEQNCPACGKHYPITSLQAKFGPAKHAGYVEIVAGVLENIFPEWKPKG